MRRVALACLIFFGTNVAFAANPYYLDRAGVLWKGTATSDGLLLTGERDGSTLVSSTVPFPLAISGANDSQIQVAADDLTGKVAVVWQRNWTKQSSEIMLAVWHGGDWERVTHLSSDLMANPRNPSIQLTQASASGPSPNAPDDPSQATLVQDSFLHVVWWEGIDQSHGSYALLRLTADPTDAEALLEQNLDDITFLGLGCTTPVPRTVLEYPMFAAQSAHDRALILFGSQRLCLLQLLEVSFAVQTTPVVGSDGMTVVAQRRRSVPIFGLMKTFPMTQELSMDGTRVILGDNLNPVAYRVDGPTIQYVTYSNQGWSPARTLAVANGLTLDQAIPLVENLAR
jgi:hypothetical protein